MPTVTELFPALALLKAGFHIAVLPCLFRTLWWAPQEECPSISRNFTWLSCSVGGALFPQRPKLVCFKEVIFRSCCLAGGKTFFLNRRADCNRIPLFPECLLPFSTIFFPFFCVTQFPFHCRLLTHVCSSSLLFHFLYHCSYCARIWYKEVCRE